MSGELQDPTAAQRPETKKTCEGYNNGHAAGLRAGRSLNSWTGDGPCQNTATFRHTKSGVMYCGIHKNKDVRSAGREFAWKAMSGDQGAIEARWQAQKDREAEFEAIGGGSATAQRTEIQARSTGPSDAQLTKLGSALFQSVARLSAETAPSERGCADCGYGKNRKIHGRGGYPVGYSYNKDGLRWQVHDFLPPKEADVTSPSKRCGCGGVLTIETYANDPMNDRTEMWCDTCDYRRTEYPPKEAGA